MHPILFELSLGGTDRLIGTYGVLLSAAMLIGAFIGARACHRAGIDWGAAVAAIGFTVAGSLLGSYVLFVLVEWAQTGSPFPAVSQGGLVFFGAPIGGMLALKYTSRGLELPLGRFVDVCIGVVPLGHALGRLGCFFGGCCFGHAFDGPWAIRYSHEMAPGAYPPILRHPTPLYEAALLLLLALAFFAIPPKKIGDGRRFFVYAVAYGVIRLVIETFRGDPERGFYFGGLVSTSQLISAALLIGGLLGLALWRRPPGQWPVPGH